MQLLEGLRRGCRVVVAHLGNADHGDPLSAQGAKLAAGHRVRHDVRRPGEPVDVGVEAAAAPCAFEPQSLLAERKLQSRDRGVKLRRKAYRVHAEACEWMIRRP